MKCLFGNVHYKAVEQITTQKKLYLAVRVIPYGAAYEAHPQLI